jgi:stearoyl-CoA desaturase (delta-9 desaturase)
MFDTVLNFLNGGLLHAGWLFKVIYFLIVTQLTIFAVTLYLHRSACHRGVDFHPIVAHMLRFWSWVSTGMVTREWVAVHRKHHAKCETEEDPHSPKFFGINTVLWQGVDLYRVASVNQDTLEKYGKGCPDDWIERHLYSAHPYWGPTLTFVVNILLFGIWGVAISALQMVWIPFWAAGVVNGVGHWWGYRNFETADMATNLSPWGLWIGGEELHNNHHAFPSSAKFALRKFEVDIGWGIICALRRALGNGGRWLDEHSRQKMQALVENRPTLRTVCDFRARLATVLERNSGGAEAMKAALIEWCREAEASGIAALAAFAARLRGYALAPVHA